MLYNDFNNFYKSDSSIYFCSKDKTCIYDTNTGNINILNSKDFFGVKVNKIIKIENNKCILNDTIIFNFV